MNMLMLGLCSAGLGMLAALMFDALLTRILACRKVEK